jgi:hypothetical protein
MKDEFLKAFDDFKKHALIEEIDDAIAHIEYLFYEQQAAELELPTDYFIQEFILN